MSRLRRSYRAKRVLLVGATGFLGGVTLSKLLADCPDLERVLVLLRRMPGLPAASRFEQRVLPSVAFDPVRDRWADLAKLVTILQGDLGSPDLGLDEAGLAEIAGVDLILNCAGLVDFEAPLDQAWRTNIEGVRHLIAVARATGAHLVHVSTCFVAGCASGRREETVEYGFFPRRDDAPYLAFDPEREVADLVDEIDRLTRGAEEQAAQARYREQALERFRTLNAGLPSQAALSNASRRIARDDLKAQLVEAGRRRAEFWGWPNVYTYSKSIGEQLLCRSEGVRWTVVRPAIIESALNYPEPGYNLNATTSAPLVMLALNGFQLAPARSDLVLDIVPVDAVASGVLAVGAAALGGKAEPVYQIGTSDVNPCRSDRVIELIGLYLHERELAKDPSWLAGVFKANREPALVDRTGFEGKTRRIEALWRKLASRAETWRSGVDHPGLREVLEKVADRAAKTAEDMDKARSLWDLFLPFSHDYDYRFVSRHIRDLWADLGEGQDLKDLDWRTYWIDIHIPGLRRHVLTDSFGKQVKPVATPMSLAERVEAVARDDANRAALTVSGEDSAESWTYGSLWSQAGAISAALSSLGLETVVIPVDNGGLWIPALLGAQRAGVVADLRGPIPSTRPGAPAARRPQRGGEDQATGGAKALEVIEAVDGTWTISAGRKKPVRVEPISATAADPPELGPSEVLNPPGIRFDGAEPVAARDLARRLERIAGWLDLEPGTTVAAAAGLAPLALLAPLHAQGELWIAEGDRLAEAIGGGAPTAAIVGAEVSDQAGRLRAVLDLAPLAGMSRLKRLSDRKVKLTQALAEGLTLAGHRDVTGGSGHDKPFSAEPEIAWEGTPWLVRLTDDATPKAWLDGRRDEATSQGALQAKLRDDRGVADAVLRGEEGARLAFVRPDPEEFRDFRGAVTHLHRLLRDLNAEAAASQRLHAMIVTFGDLPGPGDDSWEARTDWIRLSPRTEPATWGEWPDDRIPLDDLEDETMRLARGKLGPADLDFVVDHHREAVLTLARLLLLERVLLAHFRTGDRFNAQAFLQRYQQEAGRTERLEYKVGYRLGALSQKWRDWTRSEDPDGKLLPPAVTEPVKKGLGAATDAFFEHAMDVSVRGGAYIPAQGSFVVVANHSSHLDTGVIKYALGTWGDRVRALAAKDYFFGTPAKRFLAHHFTRLIPTERQAVTTEWIKRAREALGQGDCVLIFPEGTRTADPEVGPFKASLGTLLRSCQAPVLPVYVYGTHAILPKGTAFPKGRKIQVYIGPPVTYAKLERISAEAGGTLARDRMMADYVRDAVAALKAGDYFWLRETAPAGGPDE
jgi:1-acyl-sn-glycerol-3-phosphate acyltransferase